MASALAIHEEIALRNSRLLLGIAVVADVLLVAAHEKRHLTLLSAIDPVRLARRTVTCPSLIWCHDVKDGRITESLLATVTANDTYEISRVRMRDHEEVGQRSSALIWGPLSGANDNVAS
jgi:hypothetical protein